MAVDLPTRARVVIVGGGVIGCSVAYHLSKLGWSDIVLIERKQLTSGTTWHAAGLIGQLRQSINMTKLARYTAELYRGLEAETGQATGYRQCGSISLATTKDRMEELKRNASMAKMFGLPVHVVSLAEIRSLYPLVNLDDVSAASTFRATATPMRLTSRRRSPRAPAPRGVRIIQDLKVTAIHHDGGAGERRRDRAADASMPTMSCCAAACGRGIWRRASA